MEPQWLLANKPYIGEVLLGHLRYGTHGANTLEKVHPFHRPNNWITRNLILAGNFNMTNVDELFQKLLDLGQFPKEKSDTVTVLEKIGHFLDEDVNRIFAIGKERGLSNTAINQLIYDNLDIGSILSKSAKKFDGGYVIGGMLGHGDAFIMRDPNGIRPAFYYQDEEVVVVASERPPIQTAFGLTYREIKEVEPGHALIIKRNGEVSQTLFTDKQTKLSCSFERIYFSRGNDRDIYLERKKMGEQLAVKLAEHIDYDFDNTVFSYIPNTAETAFIGMSNTLQDIVNERKRPLLQKNAGDEAMITKIFLQKPRIEKLIVKDAKLRTFIADDNSRSEMVSHIYDVTYGIVNNHKDTIVLLDDSIVRGTTLRQSVIPIAARLKPAKIIIASSAPMIKYPDCYGIDMSKLGEFVAFQALVRLLHKDEKEYLLEETYHQCLQEDTLPLEETSNRVKFLYDQFADEALLPEIASLVTPKGLKIPIEVCYIDLADLHRACPQHTGDWYFSGNYPTPGGNRVVNRAFINYMEKKNIRAY